MENLGLAEVVLIILILTIILGSKRIKDLERKSKTTTKNPTTRKGSFN